jgi:hypothetical protein
MQNGARYSLISTPDDPLGQKISGLCIVMKLISAYLNITIRMVYVGMVRLFAFIPTYIHNTAHGIMRGNA